MYKPDHKTSDINETLCSTAHRNADLMAQRQAGRTACEKPRKREHKQSRGQEHRIDINQLYAKNDSRIVLFANEFRKGVSIFNQYFHSVTRPFPKLVCKGSTDRI